MVRALEQWQWTADREEKKARLETIKRSGISEEVQLIRGEKAYADSRHTSIAEADSRKQTAETYAKIVQVAEGRSSRKQRRPAAWIEEQSKQLTENSIQQQSGIREDWSRYVHLGKW
jgi:hypothetical protein